MINKKASKMLKELRESHNWCCIEISSDYCYVWNLSLIRAGSDHKNSTIVTGCYDDLNDAIEDAYIQAKQYLEKE